MTDLWGDGSGVLLDLGNDAHTDLELLHRLTKIAAAAMSSRTGADVGCAATLTQDHRTPLRTATSEATARLARLEPDHGPGPFTEAARGEIPIVLSDVSTDYRWPVYQRLLKAEGCHGVLAVSLRLDPGTQCVLTCFAPQKNLFSPSAIALATALAETGSRSLQMAFKVRAALSAAGSLQAAMETRTTINIACGVIMGQNQCSYDEAFAILARASSHRNVKVRKVADSILESLPGGAPKTHFGT